LRILLVEDDDRMSSFVRRGLEEHGHRVDVAHDTAAADECLTQGGYDLVILDRMLPGENGLTLCRRLREAGHGGPVLMLTALSSTAEKVEGLDAGADDYLSKPFEFSELLARVRALLRRGGDQGPTVLEYADLRMDLLQRTATRNGKSIRLTPKEYALLEFLMRNPERVLSRTEIGRRVWNLDFEYSNVLEVFISSLRRKVDKGFERPLIQTVVGTGYILSSEPRP